MRTLIVSGCAAALLIAGPPCALVGGGAGTGLSASDGGLITGQPSALARDPVAAATGLNSPTSRSSQAAARDSKRRADEAATASANVSATAPAQSFAVTPGLIAPGAGQAEPGLASRPDIDVPTGSADSAVRFPSLGGGVVTPTP